MTLHQVDPTNDQTVVSENLEHLTALTFVFAGDHDDLVVTTNLCMSDFSLQHFWGERDDLHELQYEVRESRPKDTGTEGSACCSTEQQHCHRSE